MEINSIPFLFMDASQLRRELHEYIDQADERIIRLMHGMLKADQELPADQKALLDERLKEYYSHPREVLTLQEMQAKYSSKNEPGSSI
ncbi:hypothetical protein [Ohtaekwangia sp.]|uniref:hypothetical protein n=1 Tax=Ohtaekwangia sp. TaxID=2066019 RepID=UPI002FDC9E04